MWCSKQSPSCIIDSARISLPEICIPIRRPCSKNFWICPIHSASWGRKNWAQFLMIRCIVTTSCWLPLRSHLNSTLSMQETIATSELQSCTSITLLEPCRVNSVMRRQARSTQKSLNGERPMALVVLPNCSSLPNSMSRWSGSMLSRWALWRGTWGPETWPCWWLEKLPWRCLVQVTCRAWKDLTELQSAPILT